jgi:autotransporter-associated beta strand protein
LTKVGVGTLLYSGTRSNAYIGTTRVDQGTLRLARTGDNRAIMGPLIVGDGIGGPEADVVEVQSAFSQIHNMAPVHVATSGRLQIEPHEGIGSLSGSGSVFLMNGLETGHDNTSTVFDGVISGPGNVRKYGTGTMTLAGFNDYSGDTVVQEGTLVINGDQPLSDVYVHPSATLAGNGWVGALSIDGTLNPGNPLGPLRAESVNFLPGSTMIERIEARSQAGAFTPYGNNWFQSYSSPVDVTGASLDISLGFPPSAGQEFKIGTALGALPPTGTFVGKPEGSLIVLNQIPFHLSYQGGSGNDIVLTVGELVLRLDSTRVEAGNGNGRIEPDECNNLFVVIENPTAAGVNVLSAYLQSLDNRIVVTQAESEYGIVPASGSRTNRTAFQLRSAPNYPCGENAEFHLVLETIGHGRFAIPVTLPTGTPGTFREFANPAGPAIIPDAGALSSQLPVTSSFKVGKVRASLHATHPSAGQLRLKLISPQGVEVLLAEGEGGAGNNYGQSCDRRTTFVDSAFVSIVTADAPFSGTYAPEGNLSDFVGLDSLGVWTLLVEDTVAGSLGALQCWTLELAPAECAPAGGGCDSCFATVNGVLDVGRTMPERLLGGYPTGCGDAPHCPTVSSVWHDPYRYTTHTFTNTGPDACVSVMLTVSCAEPNRGLNGSAYLGDFDPANLCANLLGISGDKIEQGSGGFSFRVPAGERFTVVVNERNISDPFEGCDSYSLQLFGLPCPQEQPRLHIATDAGPDNVRLHWSTAYPGFDLQGRPSLGGLVIGGFTNVNAAPVVVDGHYSVTNKHDGKGNGFFRLRKP